MVADLRSRSSSGTVWSAVSMVLSKGITFLSTIVIAHVLDPKVLGLFGIGLLIVGYLEFLNDFGISSAVINLTIDDDRLSSVAFWLNLLLGLALTIVGLIVAPAIAGFFSEPGATPIIRALSFVFLIRSLGAVHNARLKRDLKMKLVAVPETIQALGKGVVTIALALTGFGVWSLVWGQLLGATFASIALWVVSSWRPVWQGTLQGARRLLSFGSQITVVGFLGAINKNIDYVFVGRGIGTEALGVYTLAFRLPELLIDSINSIVGQVAFPVFSQLQGRPDKAREGLQTMLGMTSVVVVPIGLGLAVTAEPLVDLFYGDKWGEAVGPLRWLAVALLAIAVTKNIGDLYKGFGRPGLLNVIGLIKIAVTVPLLFIAVGYGITAVAMAQAAAAIVLSVIRLVIAAKVLDIELGSLVRQYRSPFLAGAVLVTATWPMLAVVGDWPAGWQLLVLVPVGLVAYIGSLLLIDRPLVSATMAFVQSSRAK